MSVYLKDPELTEMREMAAKLDRSLSWVIREAWKHAQPFFEEQKKAGTANDDPR